MAMDDCWIRDTGPLFLDGGSRGLAATSFRFNGWGNRRTPYAADQKLAERLLAHQNLPAYVADLVFEGGSIETDGEGTLLVTTPTLLDQRRNPGITMATAEAALRDWLGIERVIWLPHGLLEDEGGGQVENVARFAAPGIVLTLTAQDAQDANAEGLLANQAALAEAVDARGRTLVVHTLPLVRPRHAPDGRRLAVSHLSYALTNGGLIMPQFAGPSDATSRKALAAAFPGREIVEQDALTIALGGGSIHGITLPQPAAVKAGE
jgi:agmatine deiminase